MKDKEITTNNTNTELTPTGGAFATLREFNLNDTLAEELTGLSVNFERIKIPSGGTTIFEIPSENPDSPETVKEFSAVILYHHPLRAFYNKEYTGGSNPPDCGSFDGITGNGVPGGRCDKCPFNKFGSGKNDAKACKDRRRIYLLREGDIFPLIFSLPTGSLRDFTRYLTHLISKQKKSNSVITRFTLRKAVNKGGLAYSQAQFTVDRVLTPDEYSLIQRMSDQVKSFSSTVGYDNEAEEAASVVDPETGEVLEPLA